MMQLRRMTTFRLTAMLGAVFLCAMCALLSLIYVLTERELVDRTDEVLIHAAQALGAVPADRLAQEVRAALTANSSHLNHYALLDTSGRMEAGDFTPPPGLSPNMPTELAVSRGDTPTLRVMAVRVGRGQLLVVARDITQIADLRHRVVTILITSGLMTSILVLLAAVGLSAAPLRRVRGLCAYATRIAAGELSLRMPVSPRGDELDVIAATVNVMIEEVARLLEQVKGATDAIAHDLRSPLAHVRDQLANILRQNNIQRQTNPPPRGRGTLVGGAGGAYAPALAAPPTSLDDLVESVLGDLDMVLARFNSLLRISELEASNRQAGFAKFDPMALAAEVCELFEPLAEECGLQLVLSGSWGHTIRGDNKLLFEVISNLLDNAIKFTPSGGSVTVGVSEAGGVPMLVVRDNGPGIPMAERANVLRRFQRGSGARHIAGSGLGLNLVAAIVHMHGFLLELTDAGPGLEVRIICAKENSTDRL